MASISVAAPFTRKEQIRVYVGMGAPKLAKIKKKTTDEVKLEMIEAALNILHSKHEATTGQKLHKVNSSSSSSSSSKTEDGKGKTESKPKKKFKPITVKKWEILNSTLQQFEKCPDFAKKVILLAIDKDLTNRMLQKKEKGSKKIEDQQVYVLARGLRNPFKDKALLAQQRRECPMFVGATCRADVFRNMISDDKKYTLNDLKLRFNKEAARQDKMWLPALTQIAIEKYR